MPNCGVIIGRVASLIDKLIIRVLGRTYRKNLPLIYGICTFSRLMSGEYVI
jgi:hypothetical protein